MKGRRWLAPFLVVVLAALLRWFPAGTLSLGMDEAGSLFDSSAPLGDIFPRMLAKGEVHPPLHFYYLHPWIAAVSPGAFAHGGGEAWLRLSSLPWALLTVWLTFSLAERLGGRRVAVGAGLLVAASNFLVYYSLELRMYAMLTTLEVGAAWAAFERRWWGGAALCLVAFFTHYEAVWFIAALGLFCVLQDRAEWRRWLGPSLLLVLLLGVWAPVMASQAGHQAFTLRDAPSWPQAVELFFEMGWGVTWPVPLPGWRVEDGALPLWKWAGLVVALLVGAGVWRAEPRARSLLACLLLLPLAAVFVVSNVTSLRVFEYKYMQPLIPVVCIALAMWLAPHGKQAPARRCAGVAVVGAVLLVNLAAWAVFLRDAAWYGPQDWRGVATEVAEHLGPGEVVVVHPSMMAVPLLVYAWLGEPRLFTASGAPRVAGVDEADGPVLRDALSSAPGGFFVTPLAHPYVAQQRLLEHLPAPWRATFAGETSSFWPANRIAIFRLSRRER